MISSTHGLGLDGLLNFYKNLETININEISEAFIKHSVWLPNLPYPYCVAASENLLNKFKPHAHSGITATAPGFYGPQGRQLRLKTAMPKLNDLLTSFSLNNLKITNFEMETSALYGLGKLLNHRCLTVCIAIANRVRKEFASDVQKSTEILIERSLNILSE